MSNEAENLLSPDAEQQHTEADSPEDIQLAKEMGWKDPQGWKGDPPKNGFVSAREYVRRSEKVLPIVNARARKAEERASKLEQELADMRADTRKMIDKIDRMSSVALEKQREQIEARYADRIEKAAEIGDKDAVRQARKEEKEVLAAMDEKLKEPETDKDKGNAGNGKDKGLPKDVQDAVDAWKADNRWFNDTDPGSDEMSAYAMALHLRLQKEKKGLTLAENLAEVTKRVRAKFPEQFGDADDDETEDDAPKQRGSRVEGGSRMNGGGNGSLWSKLPAEAKAQADKFIKDDGLFLEKGETAEKNLSAARERYAKQYHAMEQ